MEEDRVIVGTIDGDGWLWIRVGVKGVGIKGLEINRVEVKGIGERALSPVASDQGSI
jgi:hypothetical protein